MSSFDGRPHPDAYWTSCFDPSDLRTETLGVRRRVVRRDRGGETLTHRKRESSRRTDRRTDSKIVEPRENEHVMYGMPHTHIDII